MNIQALAEIVQKRLGAYDQDSKYDDREVFAIADGVRGRYIADVYRKTGQLPAGDFVRQYDVELQPFKNLKRFKLPVIIANGVNNIGIRYLTNPTYPFTPWNPIQVGRQTQFSDADLGGMPMYWLEGQYIYAVNAPDKAVIGLIPCITELDQFDEIFGDSEIEGIVIDAVVDKLLIKKSTPELNANDGAGNN